MPKFYIDAQKRPFALRKGLFAAGLNLNARLFGFCFCSFKAPAVIARGRSLAPLNPRAAGYDALSIGLSSDVIEAIKP